MRNILHCDLNNFFASVECITHPEYAGKPVAVAGDPTERRGVILAKNYIAKAKGITTGMTINDALVLCPDLIVTPVHFGLYNYYSERVREIYLQYTDYVEPFSIDECWLDVTDCSLLYGSPKQLADRIRAEVKEKVGLTISVGVSFSKTLAKLGSDMHKPDATTEINKSNFRQLIYPLSISDVVGVGRKTRVKLNKMGIFTLGDLSRFDDRVLNRLLGKQGSDLYDVVNGWEDVPVMRYDQFPPPKSVGNSTTFSRDLSTDEEVRVGFGILAESVAKRMHEAGCKAGSLLHITIKDNDLHFWGKTIRLPLPTIDSKVMTRYAMEIYKKDYVSSKNIRLLGISMSDFERSGHQIGIEDILTRGGIDNTIERLRAKYGTQIILKADNYLKPELSKALGKDVPKKK